MNRVLRVKYIRDFLFAINLESIDSKLVPFSLRKHLDLAGVYCIPNFKITCSQVLYFESLILLDCYYKIILLKDTNYACTLFLNVVHIVSIPRVIPILQWFHDIIGIRGNHFVGHDKPINRACFEFGKLEVIQWLYNHGFTNFTFGALRDCIFYGYIDVYFWLYQKLTEPLNDNYLFMLCCDASKYSRLKILKSLLYSDLTCKKGISIHDCKALFEIAVQNGCYGVAKWLYDIFGYSDSTDALIYNYASLSYTHTKTCKWLIDIGTTSSQFDSTKVKWYNNSKPKNRNFYSYS